MGIARCAAREREASSAGWTASALQGVPAGGGREARARLPSFREIFLGEGHFPDMSHGLRCARMRIAWNHSKFDARTQVPERAYRRISSLTSFPVATHTRR